MHNLFYSHLSPNFPVFLIMFCSIIGLIAGSFLNMVISRLPKMLEWEWQQQCAESRGNTIDVPPHNIFTPRSACLHCGHKIRILESIPLINYALLRGRCPQCHASISLRYPVVEALTGFISGFIAWRFSYSFEVLPALIFVWAMIALAFIDIETQLLPNEITLPLLWTGLLINLNDGFTDIRSAVIGAVAGYFVLWLVYMCFKLITGREGMGYGDFKLLAVIGAWLGWQMLPLVILLSSLTATIAGIGLIVIEKYGRPVVIPFGPYLVVSSFIALFWGIR